MSGWWHCAFGTRAGTWRQGSINALLTLMFVPGAGQIRHIGRIPSTACAEDPVDRPLPSKMTAEQLFERAARYSALAEIAEAFSLRDAYSRLAERYARLATERSRHRA